MMRFRENIKTYDSKVNWFVFFLISSFTVGSWIDLNGMFCQLPIMELPEGWKLPSVLTITIQIAQLAPVLFVAGRKVKPSLFSYEKTNYVILSIGALSMFLLSFVWDKTAYVFGAERSVGLITLCFMLSILDGTSSVTFLPYVGVYFAKEYVLPCYVGESLSSMIPSILVLIQGLGKNPGCRNVTIGNETYLQRLPLVPNYSVSLYYIFLFILLCYCVITFHLLHTSSMAIRSRKQSSQNRRGVEDNDPDSSHPAIEHHTDSSSIKENEFEKFSLYTITFIVSFLCYAFLPGLNSYSTLPYGNHVFNYAISLSNMAIPFAVLLSIASYNVSTSRIYAEFVLSIFFASYLIFLSFKSPCPPFLDSFIGPFLAVFCWVGCQSMFMRIRCISAARLERFGHKPLVIVGLCTQIGQLFGGIVIFTMVNILDMFRPKPDCVFDHRLYCSES